jgi:asparagine synthetase B (glutamine-hydrolysing)
MNNTISGFADTNTFGFTAGERFTLRDKYSVVFSGRLYNAAEIKAELQSSGVTFHRK